MGSECSKKCAKSCKKQPESSNLCFCDCSKAHVENNGNG